MQKEKIDAFKGLAESFDKTEKEILHLLLDYQEGFKKGIITKKFLEHKKKFNLDILIRINAMKEIIQQPRTANLMLKRLREKKGLSKAQTAEKAGISRVWYSYLEAGEVYVDRGKKVNISKRIKERVCKILEVSFKDAFPVDHLIETLIKKGTN